MKCHAACIHNFTIRGCIMRLAGDARADNLDTDPLHDPDADDQDEKWVAASWQFTVCMGCGSGNEPHKGAAFAVHSSG